MEIIKNCAEIIAFCSIKAVTDVLLKISCLSKVCSETLLSQGLSSTK